jgi:mono/diheme cytochrome c family protein
MLRPWLFAEPTVLVFKQIAGGLASKGIGTAVALHTRREDGAIGGFMKRLMFIVPIVMVSAVIVSSSVWAAGDVAAGKEVYTKKCVSCHGAAGEGKDAIAKMMKVDMRALGSKEVQAKTDVELSKISKDGIGKMKPTTGLTDKDSADVVSYLRTLARK